MKAVIQRVKNAIVHIDNVPVAQIENGMLILLGVGIGDEKEDAEWLSSKIAKLRIFADENGLMNNDIKSIYGKIIVVSQFTLHAQTKKGNRPSYINAARPEQAIPLYEYFIECLRKDAEVEVQTGKFGADMQVQLINDGPVTILIDTKNKE